MTNYIFTGKTYPERANINIEITPFPFVAEDAGLKFDFQMRIIRSQISAVVDNPTQVSNMATLKNYVEGIVRTAVDGLGYSERCGYDVEITSVSASDGSHWEVFGVQERSLSESTVDFPTIWPLLISGEKSGNLRRALSDLRESIRSPVDTGFFCFRAVESIRQSFVNEQETDSRPSWLRMRNVLNIDQSYLQELTDSGTPNRHGKSPYYPGDVRKILMERSREVVARYIELLRTEVDQLPESDFPLLVI